MLDKDLKALAELLDSKFQGPFGIRFGLDGLIGLIPGIGDIVTTLLSFYIVGRCAFKKYPLPILLKMLLNIFIEFIIGIVPIIGDFFDIIWKANLKNIRLAEKYELEPKKTKAKSLLHVLLLFFFLALTFFVMLFVPIKIALWLLSSFQGF